MKDILEIMLKRRYEADIIKNLINSKLGTNYILEDLFLQSEE